MTELEKMILRATNNGKIQDYKHLRKELKSLERRSLIKCIWDEQQNSITAQITTFGKPKFEYKDKPREDSRMSLLRHGYGNLRADYPISAPVTPNLLYLTKTEACVRPHSDKLQDHYYRSSLDDRICDSSFHNDY